jgi:rhodanese-related sulfurtransferase
VLAEVARILRPGAPVVISFSNRCFPTKAVAIWLDLDGGGHSELIALYLREAGFKEVSARRLADGWIGDPMTAIIGRT